MAGSVNAEERPRPFLFDNPHAKPCQALFRANAGPFPADAEIIYGRWHHRPVGPHPDFSIQLAFPHAQFAAVMVWLGQNRNGLTIFTHPVTGESDDAQLRDHRDHAIWMGAVRPLKLAQFGGVDQA